MKNAKMTIWVMVIVFFVCSSHSFGTIHLNDGGTYNIYLAFGEDLWVDYEAPGMQTTVNWLDGAVMSAPYNLKAYEDGIINMSGGSVGGSLYTNGRSQIDISGGSIASTLSTLDCRV